MYPVMRMRKRTSAYLCGCAFTYSCPSAPLCAVFRRPRGAIRAARFDLAAVLLPCRHRPLRHVVGVRDERARHREYGAVDVDKLYASMNHIPTSPATSAAAAATFSLPLGSITSLLQPAMTASFRYSAIPRRCGRGLPCRRYVCTQLRTCVYAQICKFANARLCNLRMCAAPCPGSGRQGPDLRFP